MVTVVEIKKIDMPDLTEIVAQEGLKVKPVLDIAGYVYREHKRHFPLPPRKENVGLVLLEPSKGTYYLWCTKPEAKTFKGIAEQLEHKGYNPITLSTNSVY